MLAYVHFTEDGVRHVCPVTDIEDFSPSHVDDFVDEGKYRVLWPLLPKDGSGGVSMDYYDAIIVILAESYEDMHYKVVRDKLKMPQNLLSELMRERRAKEAEKAPRSRKDPKSQSAGLSIPGLNDGKKPKDKGIRTNESAHSLEKTERLKPKTTRPLRSSTTSLREPASSSSKIIRTSPKNVSPEPIETLIEDQPTQERTPLKVPSDDKFEDKNMGKRLEDPPLSDNLHPNSDPIDILQQECGECVQLRRKLKRKQKESEANTQKINELSQKVIVLQDQLLGSGKKAANPKAKRMSPSQKLKKKQAEASKPKDYQTSLELAPMISDAIKGKTPLCSSGDKVHIGNGVYISKEIWEDKLVSSKGTLAVRDLADEVYDLDDLAARSLEGGKCPNPNSAVTRQKVKATPKKVEAILGIYVGKMMAKGITDAESLSLTIKNGRATLAQKFKESYIKWNSLREEDEGDSKSGEKSDGEIRDEDEILTDDDREEGRKKKAKKDLFPSDSENEQS
ncbi:hypothetical protein FOCC_FOCC014105 [Frankliniella occidentalis]|uniref:Uncharacterized protein LOC113207613 n=1 Tax=Frankliniella occidentalis TaxID=133901 RepID=A0A6J1SH43_FRAOC|nr:uncharacterized protein LOC113207613 [Frankliniella occidentalis]KAE8740369.1 hypothetical protein FOCC_FOCC014105 [Frankliniella occidentalis]